MTRFMPFTPVRRIVALAMASLLLAASPAFTKDNQNDGYGNGKHSQKEFQKAQKH